MVDKWFQHHTVLNHSANQAIKTAGFCLRSKGGRYLGEPIYYIVSRRRSFSLKYNSKSNRTGLRFLFVKEFTQKYRG